MSPYGDKPVVCKECGGYYLRRAWDPYPSPSDPGLAAKLLELHERIDCIEQRLHDHDARLNQDDAELSALNRGVAKFHSVIRGMEND